MIDLAALIAAHMAAMPKPDAPNGARVQRGAGPTHPTRLETRLVNGKWVLVPVAYAPGPARAPVTKVSYTPLPR